jgi:flagellar protein FliO/FliZ
MAIEVESKQVAGTVSYAHVLNWSIGLIIVLGIFFACVWFMKKMGALQINAKDNMKVVGGLSLGMREKLVLVQLGEKQLLLGITPGNIEKLMVLEGEDKLFQKSEAEASEADFSSKLKQVMRGTANE